MSYGVRDDKVYGGDVFKSVFGGYDVDLDHGSVEVPASLPDQAPSILSAQQAIQASGVSQDISLGPVGDDHTVRCPIPEDSESEKTAASLSAVSLSVFGSSPSDVTESPQSSASSKQRELTRGLPKEEEEIFDKARKSLVDASFKEGGPSLEDKDNIVLNLGIMASLVEGKSDNLKKSFDSVKNLINKIFPDICNHASSIRKTTSTVLTGVQKQAAERTAVPLADLPPPPTTEAQKLMAIDSMTCFSHIGQEAKGNPNGINELYHEILTLSGDLHESKGEIDQTKRSKIQKIMFKMEAIINDLEQNPDDKFSNFPQFKEDFETFKRNLSILDPILLEKKKENPPSLASLDSPKQAQLKTSSQPLTPPISRDNAWRTAICEETIRCCQGYETPGKTHVSIDSQAMIASTKTFGADVPKLSLPNPRHKTVFKTTNGDTMSLLARLSRQYPAEAQPIGLNMANRNFPGGGWKHGARAQEEDLCRRSNYSLALDAAHEARGKGPIPRGAGVYTKDVQAFRGKEEDGFPLLEKPDKMAFVGVAAYNLNDPVDLRELGLTELADLVEKRAALRQVIEKKEGEFKDVANEKNKLMSLNKSIFDKTQKQLPKCDIYINQTKLSIRNMLRTMASNGHDRLVLGALGCGMFANPPELVAKMFGDVLGEDEFLGRFKSVEFGVLARDGNPAEQGNLKTFEAMCQKLQEKIAQ